ncbi:hypothetical protein LSAT2_032501 [Lamellibrachia satsuma]|nr:hypothetical protein LSAT2_032501 [Lamellibrachia satsuma]
MVKRITLTCYTVWRTLDTGVDVSSTARAPGQARRNRKAFVGARRHRPDTGDSLLPGCARLCPAVRGCARLCPAVGGDTRPMWKYPPQIYVKIARYTRSPDTQDRPIHKVYKRILDCVSSSRDHVITLPISHQDHT